MCVFPNLSRSVGGYENHQNARAHFSRRGIVIHLLIFHFFLSPMTGAFAKSSRNRSFFAALSKTAAWGERVNEKIYCRITPAAPPTTITKEKVIIFSSFLVTVVSF